MGTCSVTCQVHGNSQISDKYKINKNIPITLDPVKSGANNDYDTRQSPYFLYAKPTTSTSTLPGCTNIANTSSSPTGILKPIKRQETVPLIRNKRNLQRDLERDLERKKKVHEIQETFKDAYRNSIVRPSRAN